MANASFLPAKEKIDGFRSLKEGWDYKKGMPFEEPVLEAALSLDHEAAQRGFETDAFPGPEGDVLVTLYFGAHYLEFMIDADLTVDFCQEENEKEVCCLRSLSLEGARAKIQEMSSILGVPHG